MRVLAVLFLCLLAAGCRGDSAGAREVAAGPYRQVTASRDGIGKVYEGREISQVMGHLGAGWLERPQRERQERTDLLISRLPLEPDDVVADIGAGTGYFSFPVARRVPEGRVIAVDIQPQMLQLIRERRAAEGVDNLETVLGSETDPGLAPLSVDLAFIVDAYHEFSHPLEMGRALVRALRPGGKLVLVEYRAEDPAVPIKPLHKMSEKQVRREMAALGLEWVVTEDYLPQQHVLIFEKPAGPEDQ
jgi:precorrin-6B methylase 2